MKVYYWAKPEKGVFCHYIESKDSLPDISDASIKEGQAIFFHETSCSSYMKGKISVTARQACAVESTARMNPDREIYLLYASPGNYIFENTESDRFLKELMEYPNINIYHVDMNRYLKGSPVEDLWKKEKMRYSQYAQSHTSDVLRFLTLWKYGGIYLDLDVIITKNLDDLGTDFSGVESATSVAAGILGFNATGKGHDYVTSCLQDLQNTFKGHDWGWNGPGTITRLLKKLCGVTKVNDMVGKTCQGFKIYPPDEFYAIPYWNWKLFFEPEALDSVMELTNSSHLIHVWNKFSITTKIPLNVKGVPYLEQAKQYCPHIIRQCDKYF
ncbi:unnamed protein product [Ceutorhynchus assimilis]|uniref:Alpha 1,4-glycosyltransferase domain-containing protein n=1 Tax=Ceutorhynchus assimilis TaxID=467358 RepID=A0A9N9MND7_9CUCU|nr:unnamed protein product [Ceutorhynchus assimilis]